jgi:RHS repeat-associated protein
MPLPGDPLPGQPGGGFGGGDRLVDRPGGDAGDPFTPEAGGAGSDGPLQCAAGGSAGDAPLINPAGGNAATYSQIGNPIDLGTGNKLQSEHDYTGWRPHGLRFHRHYNSVLGEIDGGLGHGWRHSYQRSVISDPEQPGLVTIWRDDGSQYRFERRDGQWHAPLGIVEQLAPVEDAAGNHNGWTYTAADGAVEHYDATGRLTRIDHASGHHQALHYDSEGRLARIADGRGEAITLRWRGRHLRLIALPHGERIGYRYDDRLNLVEVIRRVEGLAGLIAGWRHPERRYHYEDKRHPHALTGLDDATGRRFASWTYDAVGRATSSEHGDGAERVTLDWQPAAGERLRRVAVTNALGHRATYTLEPARPGKWRLRAIDGQPAIDCAAVRQRHRYDEHGFLRHQFDAEGTGSTYRRDTRGRVTEARHGLRFDDRENPHAEPGAIRIDYQWEGNPPQPARETRYGWVAGDGRGSGRWQAVVRHDRHHDPRGRLVTESVTDLTDAPDRTDSRSAPPESITRTTRYHYVDEGGEGDDPPRPRQLAVTDARGHVTRYRYDDQEHLSTLTNALGRTTRLDTYNRHGQPERVTLPDGQQLLVGYDARGLPIRLARHPAPGGEAPPEITRADYDAAGRLTTLRRPDGNRYHYAYNAAGQPTRIETGRGERIELTPNRLHGRWETLRHLDADGALHHRQQRRFNALGQLAAHDGNAGQQTAFDYDPHGNPIRLRQGHEDPTRVALTRTTEARYDSLHRLLELIDAAGMVTGFGYDAGGGLARIEDANGNVTTYERNGFGEVIRLTSPTTGTVINRYDGNGNLTEKRSAAGNGLRFEYDPLNRLVRADYPGEANDITYTYDQHDDTHGNGLGRLTRIETATQTIDYRYDDLGRKIAETTTDKAGRMRPAHISTLQYRYLPGNRPAAITYPNGHTTTYHYDEEGIDRITYTGGGRTHVILEAIDHAPFGGPIRWTYGNGLSQERQLDVDGRVTGIVLRPAQRLPWPGHGAADDPLWSQQYGYDLYQRIIRIDRRQQRVDGTLETETQRFDYDPVGRLIGETTDTATRRYAYDPVGNRTHEVHDGENVGHAYIAGNQLVRRGDTTLLRDDVGNLIGERGADGRQPPHRGFLYGLNNLPAIYHENGRPVARYRYNALGLRTAKERIDAGGRQAVRYSYAPDTRLLAERHRDRATHYIWLGQTPVAAIRLDGERVTGVDYLHSDHLHTPRIATDGARRVIWRWSGNAFGDGAADGDPDNDGVQAELNLRFPGQYADTESGLHYNVLRYYDPRTGRYLQSDPIGLRGGINSYAYVDANPLSYVDPLGLFLFAFDGTRNDGDNLGGVNARALTNVAHLTERYQIANGEGNASYQPGVGTGRWLDPALGSATGLGSRGRVRNALEHLDELLRSVSWDRTLDIIGFSRGAAAAREFANEIFKRIDANGWDELVTACNPLNIRFMGLFDTVGSMGLPGNGNDIGYDLTIDDRIGKVAHAVALNEHRWLFPLASVSPAAGASVTNGRVVEQGFIGAHSNIGGGYADSDLSDIALQWMYRQAVAAGVPLAPLKTEHRTVTNPVIHDERRGELDVIISDQGDRAIYYPNDLFESKGRACERRERGRCVQWEPVNPAERQKTAPQFPALDGMIREDYNGSVRGTVDMEKYEAWLEQQGVEL